MPVLAAISAGCSRSSDLSKMDDLGEIDAVETALRISRGDMTAVQSIDAAIERAKRIDPLINAIVTQTYDAARERAAGADGAAGAAGAAGADGEVQGPWWGVPSFIKDLANVSGVATGYGSRAYNGNVAEEQSSFIDEYFQNGMISLGKSSTPEFGLTATTEPLSRGATRNPWNLGHSTGGSSGGAAALVAAGVVPVAHSGDGGGSIRIPASCCGLVGLKMSRGRVAPVRDESKTPLRISINGVVSRTVRDTAAFLAMMETSKAADGLPPVGVVTGPGKARLKIGYFTGAPAGALVDKDVVEATAKAAGQCAELGHEVTQIDTPFDASVSNDFLLYWAAYADSEISKWEAGAGRRAGYNDFEPLTFGLSAHYQRNKDQLERAVIRLISFGKDHAAAFGGYDVLLSPVVGAPPPEIGFLAPDIAYDVAMERLSAYAAFTALYNISGAPSISLPLGQSAKGLPIGALFGVKRNQERVLLELAYELEEAFPWRDRRPGVYA